MDIHRLFWRLEWTLILHWKRLRENRQDISRRTLPARHSALIDRGWDSLVKKTLHSHSVTIKEPYDTRAASVTLLSGHLWNSGTHCRCILGRGRRLNWQYAKVMWSFRRKHPVTAGWTEYLTTHRYRNNYCEMNTDDRWWKIPVWCLFETTDWLSMGRTDTHPGSLHDTWEDIWIH